MLSRRWPHRRAMQSAIQSTCCSIETIMLLSTDGLPGPVIVNRFGEPATESRACLGRRACAHGLARQLVIQESHKPRPAAGPAPPRVILVLPSALLGDERRLGVFCADHAKLVRGLLEAGKITSDQRAL